MKISKNFFLISLSFTLLCHSAYAMQDNEENDPQKKGEIRRKQITFKEACPGISLSSHNQAIIVQFANDTTDNAKRNFATLINRDGNFLNKFKNRYVKFLGLNDQYLAFVQDTFSTLLANNVHCIISYCPQSSQLDQLLAGYYTSQPQSISVYRDDEISLTEWIVNSQYHQDMLATIERPEFDFSGEEFYDYDENHRADQQSTSEYLREHPDQ